MKSDANERLREELDYWVKNSEIKLEAVNKMQFIQNENSDNINHNYELIKEMQIKINSLTKEMEKIKHFNYIAFKRSLLTKISYD
jgi:hypothetical protein